MEPNLADEGNTCEYCTGDRRCSWYSECLAIDTSHVCVLVRVANELSADGGTQLPEQFASLLDRHRCGGGHDLITSAPFKAPGGEMDLAWGNCRIRDYGELPLDALEPLRGVDAGAGNNFPSHAPGGGDLSLLAAARLVSRDNGPAVLLLTDDEELKDWVEDVATGVTNADIAFLSRHSIDFMGDLHTCQAINFEVIEALEAAEERHLRNRLVEGSLGEDLHQRKMERLRIVINRAAMESN